ncbi:MAG: UvrD-helicase domain-containing protein [Treponema sp.]|jgi:ATP-dependent helicase/nuclease subunit A|nr:UvrD-helicase domain-containing protein [Treponema sp.]
MSCELILAELDTEQRKAATTQVNAVVAAGAGSGKTKVLAARYAWLIMEQGYQVEEILTLTFTNKAVSEMYSRIHGLLAAQRDNQQAQEAVANFHKAKISTLDSFCATIARTAAPRYGISPDFKSDNLAVRDMAREASLPFVLDHRDNPALQGLMADRKIKIVAEELFAETVLEYSSISNPLDFQAFMDNQGRELLAQWETKTQGMELLVETITQELMQVTKKNSKLYGNLGDILKTPMPPAPDIRPLLEKSGFCFGPAVQGASRPWDEGAIRRHIAGYFDWLFTLKSVSLSGNHSGEFTIIKECLRELKDTRYGELESIANMVLQADSIAAIFPLVDAFQRQCNQQKRERGLLTFNDISHLAVDALARYPDIRQVYKDAIRAIMIDEFQDNNGLQRDLIFLLAEQSDRNAPGLPRSAELCSGKVFFVGDEKQSIYRFRGADVSVFRGLAETLPSGSGGDNLDLIRNYRSKPILIAAFNQLFGGIPLGAMSDDASRDSASGIPPRYPGVFPPASNSAADFEARYSPVYSPRAIDPQDLEDPPVYFCFLDEDRLPQDDPQGLSTYELEAAFIASKIRELIDTGYSVPHRGGGSRPCTHGDFAVLQRSYSHQHSLEKQFKDFGIPYNADRPTGLFSDAPINDIYNFLRLLVYPDDRIAYAALIRSPFMRLSDLTLSVCMLNDGGEPFDAAQEDQIPPGERERYRQGRVRYEALAKDARVLPITRLLTKFWYDEGYRYETVWSPGSQIYAELFDLFFELARDIDRRGKTLADFLDYLEDLINQEERPDDLAIPAEREPGVRIMSIHKSKGLEFPVVFVYCCGAGGKPETNTSAVYFSETWGVTLNLPQAAELPSSSGNYFFNLQREEEERKRIAELRRLLYVAMTRAESALFVSATLPPQTQLEKKTENLETEEYTEALIWKRLVQLREKKKEHISSFLDLLLPVLVPWEGEQGPFSIRVIPAWSRQELHGIRTRAQGADGYETQRLSMKQAAAAAAPFYAGAAIITTPQGIPDRIPASSLHYGTWSRDEAGAVEADRIDLMLESAGLESADFGTIVHSFLDARFNGRKPCIPSRILARLREKDVSMIGEAAQTMAERFFNSELGRRSMAASYRETEFPILTRVQSLQFDRRNITITGQIDLLFESTGTSQASAIHVVDFKTDHEEEPRRHFGQLAVYERAIADIFGKPVHSWLFYLRSGNVVELTPYLKAVDIEKLVAP